MSILDQEARLKALTEDAVRLQTEGMAMAFAAVITEILATLTRKGILADADIQMMLGRLDTNAAILSKTASASGGSLADIALVLRHAFDSTGTNKN